MVAAWTFTFSRCEGRNDGPMAFRMYRPGVSDEIRKRPSPLVYALAMMLRSGPSNSTSAPICGTPAESRTTPDTEAVAAPQSEAVPRAISTAKPVK